MPETGYECYRDGYIDPEESLRLIEGWQTIRNFKKYGDFLKVTRRLNLLLRLFQVKDRQKRVLLYRYMYGALRLYDDICDGDTLQVLSLEERKKLIKEKEGGSLYIALKNGINNLSRELGIEDEIASAIEEIEKSIQFDLDRILSPKKIRNKESLKENFHKMDIEGTISGTAAILGLDTKSAIEQLQPLGEASRLAYNLRDLDDDINSGLINIPEEDLKAFQITDLELKLGIASEYIKKRVEAQIERLRELLDMHKKTFSQISLAPQAFKGEVGYFRTFFNNSILRLLVLPRLYTREIEEIIRNPQSVQKVSFITLGGNQFTETVRNLLLKSNSQNNLKIELVKRKPFGKHPFLRIIFDEEMFTIGGFSEDSYLHGVLNKEWDLQSKEIGKPIEIPENTSSQKFIMNLLNVIAKENSKQCKYVLGRNDCRHFMKRVLNGVQLKV